MKTALLGSLIALLLPLTVEALSITEVMHDALGSDAGREWIEVSTETALSLEGYTLFENNTNHRLTVAQGRWALAAGEVAVIVSNTQKFLADFPSYSGTIYKSSFSLSNTGEALVIRDAALTEVASARYDVSAHAPAEGNSLHYRGGTLVPGAPNPGSLAETAAIVKEIPLKNTSTERNFVKKSDIESAQVAAVGAREFQSPQISTLWTVLGLGALMVLGISAVLYIQHSKKSLNVTKSEEAEFTLVDHG